MIKVNESWGKVSLQKIEGQVVLTFSKWRRLQQWRQIDTLQLPFLQKALSTDSLALAQERQLSVRKRLSLHTNMLQVVFRACLQEEVPTNAGSIYVSDILTQAVRPTSAERQVVQQLGWLWCQPCSTEVTVSRASCHWNHTDPSTECRSYYTICSGAVSTPNRSKA